MKHIRYLDPIRQELERKEEHYAPRAHLMDTSQKTPHILTIYSLSGLALPRVRHDQRWRRRFNSQLLSALESDSGAVVPPPNKLQDTLSLAGCT